MTMMGDQSITLAAHAKLNLALAVGPPQPPRNYHPISSWFVAIGLHDTVRLTRKRAGQPSQYVIRWADESDGTPAPRPTPIDWPLDRDLAVRAHRQLEISCGQGLPVHMEVVKRTPVGGGLGGGSSDAAAAMIGLNRLFQLGLSAEELAALSQTIGSDVAFFIDPRSESLQAADTDDPPTLQAPRSALVSGFGDHVQRVRVPPMTDVLLLLPPFGCPTGPVYQAFDRAPAALRPERVSSLIADCERAGRIAPSRLFNDLAAPACMVEPRLGDMLKRLDDLGPHKAHVTGSGSTMFVIPDPESPIGMEALAARVEALVPELIVVPTGTV